MPVHVEQAAREGIAAILAAALPSVTVHAARARPMGSAEDGAVIEILQASEVMQPFGSCTGSDYERDMEIMVVGYAAAAGVENAANARADLRLGVERALHGADLSAAQFRGLVEEITMTRVDLALDPAAFPGASFAITCTCRSTASLAAMQAAS